MTMLEGCILCACSSVIGGAFSVGALFIIAGKEHGILMSSARDDVRSAIRAVRSGDQQAAYIGLKAAMMLQDTKLVIFFAAKIIEARLG